MDKNKKLCSACSEPIPVTAKVCSKCHEHQNRFVSWLLFMGNFGLITTIISFGVLMASIYQLQEAKNERISAGIASQKASIALAAADSLKLENEKIYSLLTIMATNIQNTADSVKYTSNDVRNTSRELKLISKYNLENTYILGSESFMAAGADKPASDRIVNNMSILMGLLMSPSEQKRFNASMDSVFSFRK